MSQPPVNDQSIDISVIVPYKTFSNTKEILVSLEKQDYTGRFETILVEGGNIAQARNHGISLAQGEFVAFTDSDCIPRADWLTKMSNYLTLFTSAGGVGGIGDTMENSDMLSQSIDAVYDSYLGSLGSPSLAKTRNVSKVEAISSHNSVFHKTVLDLVGGYNEIYILNEDTELCKRITESGYDLFLVPDSVVYHKRKETYREFMSKFFNWGVSRARAILTSPKMIDLKILALFAGFISNILLALLIPSVSVILTSLYLGVILLNSLYIGAIKKTRLIPNMIILYLLQHLGYAFGLIFGLLKGKYKESTENPEFKTIIKRIG